MSGVVTVVQARCGSTRLPGKVLLPLGGAPALERMLERVRRSRLHGTLVVASTWLPEDDRVEQLCRGVGVPCYRGHPTDLLDRHYQVARAFEARLVVKIPSDCVLVDPAAIDRVLAAALDAPDRYDYVSNLHPESWPDGNDVEVCRFRALEEAWREAERPLDREHTTPHLWDHPARYRLLNVAWETGRDLSRSHRVVLDYAADYEVIRRVFDALHPAEPRFGAAAVAAWLDDHPDVAALNACYRGVTWYRHHAGELLTVPASGAGPAPGQAVA